MGDREPFQLLADRTARAHGTAELIARYEPLIRSACRRVLISSADVDDAVQETFVRLLTRGHLVDRSLPAWLVKTARTSSLLILRRRQREVRRRELLSRSAAAWITAEETQRSLIRAAIIEKMPAALLDLEEPARALLTARYFRKEPLRVLAGPAGSIATTARRVAAAVVVLAEILRSMGISAVDDDAVLSALSAGDRAYGVRGEELLRIDARWHGERSPIEARLLPGWQRPLRVGVLVSYASFRTPLFGIVDMPIEPAVAATSLMDHPGIEHVAIVDPGSSDLSLVERIMRDYDLTAGLIESNDVSGLQTLDVILLGLNFWISPRSAEAIATAVRSGVGLLNEAWTGTPEQAWTDPNVRALSLADSPIYQFHTTPCLKLMPATVRDADPLLPGLAVGTNFDTFGCGPVYRFTSGTRVLISKDHIVMPAEHGILGVGASRMPVIALGELGRGRVMLAIFEGHQVITRHLSISPTQYMANVLLWLAQPRREAGDENL